MLMGVRTGKNKSPVPGTGEGFCGFQIRPDRRCSRICQDFEDDFFAMELRMKTRHKPTAERTAETRNAG